MYTSDSKMCLWQTSVNPDEMQHNVAFHQGLHFWPDKNEVQEVFYVYLNKFENAVSHLFLVILGNN